MESASLFAKHVKPELAKVLGALALDVEYIRGQGNTLWYRDRAGKEVPVLDMMGGYGSVILGHNHSILVEHARDLLARGTPIHAQFSVRSEAGELARDLDLILQRELPGSEPFITTFANSGAEAVEAAIKHAELDRVMRLSDILDEQAADLDEAREAHRVAQITVEEDFFAGTEVADQIPEVRSFDELAAGLVLLNTPRLQRRPTFVVMERSFHGKLVGSVQLTHNRNFRRPFLSLGLRVRFVPFNDVSAVDALVADERRTLYGVKLEDGRLRRVERPLPAVAAVLVEPIQGEGGVHVVTPEFARALRRCCNQLACPLIVDEIQSGVGRSGAFLASSLLGLRGDCYTLSKSLGGGIAKISAMLVRRSLYRKDFGLIHSSTFADDAFSASIGSKVLTLLEADQGAAYRRCAERGAALKSALERVRDTFPDVVKEVRGLGLFLGLELRDQEKASSSVLAGASYTGSLGYLVSGYLLRRERIRVVPTGSAPNVLRFEPSIDLDDGEVAHVEAALVRVCQMLRGQDALPLVHSLAERDGTPPRLEVEDFRVAVPDASPAPPTTQVRKVAFVNHLISHEWLRQADPSLADLDDGTLRRFVLNMSADKRVAPYPPVRIQSPLGPAVDFILYPLCVGSEQMGAYLASGDLTEIRDDVEDRVRAAAEDGCEVAGLGMYTSIVTNNCMSLRAPRVALTSGNSLTVAMGVQAVERAVAAGGWRMDELTLAVVGAAGNIASTYCSLFADRVARIVAVGSGRADSPRRLRALACQIYQQAWTTMARREHLGGIAARLAEEPFIRRWLAEAHQPCGEEIAAELEARYGESPFFGTAVDMASLTQAQVVLCAANAPEPFLGAEHFRDRAVVCDIAVPGNVRAEVTSQRPDVLILQGGIVATPNGESLHPGARAFLGPGQLFACMAETAVLGLAGISHHYSYGPLTRDRVNEIAQLAHMHGFWLADYRRGRSL